MRASNIGGAVILLFHEKDYSRETDSGFQPVMILIQEIFNFLATRLETAPRLEASADSFENRGLARASTAPDSAE
jgi:hypothetical protein